MLKLFFILEVSIFLSISHQWRRKTESHKIQYIALERLNLSFQSRGFPTLFMVTMNYKQGKLFMITLYIISWVYIYLWALLF